MDSTEQNSGTSEAFDKGEEARYLRHFTLPEIGREGQRRLKEASVLVVGAGGLGSPALLYLAAAGVGRIGIIDFDIVDASNLQRQIIYGEADIGRAKALAAGEHLRSLNPYVRVESYDMRLNATNVMSAVRGYDLVLDGSDNFAAKYALNDACVLQSIPLVIAGIYRFEGQMTVIQAPTSPCYRCLFPEVPDASGMPNCAETGVAGPLPGIVGSLQAMEAVKLLVGIGSTLSGKLLVFDALSMSSRSFNFDFDPACLLCSAAALITSPMDYAAGCAAAQPAAEAPLLSAAELRTMMTQRDSLTLIDVREEAEYAAGHLAGAMVIPLGRLTQELDSLRSLNNIVVYCHSGRRSLQAASILQQANIPMLGSLKGGLLQWPDAELEGRPE